MPCLRRWIGAQRFAARKADTRKQRRRFVLRFAPDMRHGLPLRGKRSHASGMGLRAASQQLHERKLHGTVYFLRQGGIVLGEKRHTAGRGIQRHTANKPDRLIDLREKKMGVYLRNAAMGTGMAQDRVGPGEVEVDGFEMSGGIHPAF
jgi:hypothetical protein